MRRILGFVVGNIEAGGDDIIYNHYYYDMMIDMLYIMSRLTENFSKIFF